MAAKQNVKRRIVDAAWELFYEKGYDDTTVDDIIRLSETSKGSFYYYFSSKDSLLDTLSTILDELDPEMNSFDKLMYLNYRSHSFMEQKIDVALLSSLYSTQLIAKGDRNLLDQNRTYYKLISRIIEGMCEIRSAERRVSRRLPSIIHSVSGHWYQTGV